MAAAPSESDICFIHTIFCHTGLPRSPVARAWFSRSSGTAWLTLFAGDVATHGGQVALPFGSLPRLLLVWLSTAALRTQNHDLCLGPSISTWLREVGMASDGRRYLAFRRQLQALAETRLAIGFQQVEFDGRLLFLPALSNPRLEADGTRTDSTGDSVSGQADDPIPLHIRLSPAYVQTLSHHAVPLRWTAVRHLRGSSLSLDMYFWLSCRLYRLRRKPLFLSWEQLHTQFGMEYRTREGVRLFRRELLRRLPDISQVYPAARMEVLSDGMWFFPSPSPVSPRRR